MDVGSTTTNWTTSTQKKADESSGATLDYNAFLKLLIAQMQNQDPLEPMKSSDYVAQLATFSQVEKSVEMNARMNEVLSAVQMQQASTIIGQKITSADGEVAGTVESAKLVNGGVVAILGDGRELVIGPGVVVGGRST